MKNKVMGRIGLIIVTMFMVTQCKRESNTRHEEARSEHADEVIPDKAFTEPNEVDVRDLTKGMHSGDLLLLEFDFQGVVPWESFYIRRKDDTWGSGEQLLILPTVEKKYAKKVLVKLDEKQGGRSWQFDTEYVLSCDYIYYTFKTPKKIVGKKHYRTKVVIQPKPFDLGRDSKSPYILDIQLDYQDMEPSHSLTVASPKTGWKGITYGLNVSAFSSRQRYATELRFRLGDNQTTSEWLFDTEYEYLGELGFRYRFRTPKKEEGKTHYSLKISIRPKKKPPEPVSKRVVKLTFDTSGLNIKDGCIMYSNDGEEHSERFNNTIPATYMVEKLGGELGIYRYDNLKNTMTVVAYVNKVKKADLGEIAAHATISETKNKLVKTSFTLLNKVDKESIFRIYKDKTWLPVMKFIVPTKKKGEKVELLAYPGKWILFTNEVGVRREIEITEKGQFIYR